MESGPAFIGRAPELALLAAQVSAAVRGPVGVGHCGNTSAASTLILLDEDRRAGRVRDGDLVAFLWIGAGNGAMNGYAAMVL